MKVKDVVERSGICNSSIIIVHVGTYNIKTTTPEELRGEIIITLQAVKVKNRQSHLAFSNILTRKGSQLLNAKAK